jgi:transglutaminase-like putative cysteine protease
LRCSWTLGATYATHRTLLGRDAGVTLVVILLALKTLELRARRDAFVIFFLSFFAMLTNFFYSQSLLTALTMLLALLGLLTALVNAHMPVGRPPLMQAARTAGWMALAGAPIMLALFMLFPRLAPLWGTPGDAMAGRTGLSNTMRVGTIAELALDEGIAARIKFDNDKPPPQSQLYFRGPVLAQFDGREWTALPFWARGGQGAANLRVSGEPVRYEVTLEPSNRPLLLTLDVAQKAPVGAGLEVTGTSDMQWFANRPLNDLVRYRAESYTQFQSGPLKRTGAQLQAYLALPPNTNPRTAALAAEMRADPALANADTPAFVQAALRRLRTGGYTYTLEPGVYGNDTADEFWFDRKEGFCEHIASAFVVLMRALDIPARIVTGYQGGELNDVDGYWVLLQADAHAWAEVWQAGKGWTRVDPTASVSPGAHRRLSAVGTAARPVRRRHRHHEPHAGAEHPRRVGGGEQRLEPVGAQLHAEPPARPLEEHRLRGAQPAGPGDVLLWVLIAASLAGAAWTLWERSQHDPWLRLLGRARAAARQGRPGLAR